jgi:hypothetical protein
MSSPLVSAIQVTDFSTWPTTLEIQYKKYSIIVLVDVYYAYMDQMSIDELLTRCRTETFVMTIQFNDFSRGDLLSAHSCSESFLCRP